MAAWSSSQECKLCDQARAGVCVLCTSSLNAVERLDVLSLYRTAGDVLRNFGARGVTGIRGAYERLIKVGYGLSILGTVPLVVLPFQDSLGPLLAAWMQPWSKSADKKEGVDDSVGKRTHLQEQFITTAVLGERSDLCTTQFYQNPCIT